MIRPRRGRAGQPALGRRTDMVCLAAFWVLASCTGLFGTDWYVSVTGNDTNTGLSASCPLGTIQAAVDRAVVGETIFLRGGTYREFVDLRRVEPAENSALAITAFSNETPVICGSDLFTNWTLHSESVWKATNVWEQPQQVFESGVPLQLVGWPNLLMASNTVNMYRGYGSGLDDMTNGTFFYDTNTCTLFVDPFSATAPSSGAIEVSSRFLVLHQRPQDTAGIVLKGVTFRHSNVLTFKRSGWYTVMLGRGSRIEDCTFEQCDFAALSVGHNAVISNCRFNANGSTGIGWNRTTNVLVTRCTITSNNTRGFLESWHAGGIKTIPHSGGRVEKCEVAWNLANGIWFDRCRSGAPIEIEGNYVHDNHAFPHPTIQKPGRRGIFVEISRNALVCNNILERNEIGIIVSGSDNIRVLNNTISECSHRAGIQLYLEQRYMQREEEWASLTSNRVANNILYNNSSWWDVSMRAEDPCTSNLIVNNVSDYNCFYRTNGTPVFRRDTTVWTSLSAWTNATGWDTHSVVQDPGFAGEGD